MPKHRAIPPHITGLSYSGGKPFVSGVELVIGQEYTVTATVNTQTKSVKWKRDGNVIKTDSAAPFNYTWTPTAIGAHTFAVIPYSATNGSGTAGQSLTVNWTVKAAPPPSVATALVSWSQITNATGYRVFWGEVSKQYSWNHDVTTFNYRVPDLVRGKKYFFSAKSFNTSEVSDFGNEVAFTP